MRVFLRAVARDCRHLTVDTVGAGFADGYPGHDWRPANPGKHSLELKTSPEALRDQLHVITRGRDCGKRRGPDCFQRVVHPQRRRDALASSVRMNQAAPPAPPR